MQLDDERCYAAMQGRDGRFDGWFVVAVSSTGIYCRPSCPARTPRRENVTFHPTAAAAQEAGFRACRRCRPDATPGSPEWRGRADVAARAMQLVLDGVVDREGVGGLARRLGYSGRQLQRLLVAELGAGPAALARAQRAQTARLLLERSELPISAVAFAAGFTSIRQFNETMRQVYAGPPRQLRAAVRREHPRTRSRPGRPLAGRVAAAVTVPSGTDAGSGAAVPLSLRLAYRAPFAAEELLAFLGARAVAGIEDYDGACYRRTLSLAHGVGTVELRPGAGAVQAEFALSDLRDLSSAVSRCRHLLNLDADPTTIDEALALDPLLETLVGERPGLRVPGSVDGFELAVRAVLGQQVSLAQARRLLAGLVRAADRRLSPGLHREATGGLTHLFPGPEELGALVTRRPELLGGLQVRRRALVELCAAVGSGMLSVDAGTAPGELRRGLLELGGVGPWTAEYVAMRALGDPDAFLASDLGSRRAARALGLAADPASLTQHAERWRPWRAHAQLHLWTFDARAQRHSEVPQRRSASLTSGSAA